MYRHMHIDRAMTGLAKLIATVGYVGYVKPASGTWGSLAALPLAWLVHQLGGFPLLLLSTIAVTIVGVWATRVMCVESGNSDPSEVVVDEVAGQWIALIPLSAPAWWMQVDVLALWPGWIAAFCLFRLFDIWKPGPIGHADRRGDAWGVMLDDLIAGAFAAIGVVALAALAHGVFM